MDAWCALWFWPLTDEIATVDGELVEPPTLEQWIDALQQLLGLELKVSRKDQQQFSFADIDSWDDLGAAEEQRPGVRPGQGSERRCWPRIRGWWCVNGLPQRHGFFHWELDFAPVFARGGFDLQVGNPPWVRPDFDEKPRSPRATVSGRWRPRSQRSS